MLEGKERVDLLGRVSGEGAHILQIFDDESQAMNYVKNLKRMLKDSYSKSKVDWLSLLPESLLYKVLMNLPTKDVVKSSVLSKRWRNLWRYVPALDLDWDDFPDNKTCASFVDAFLGFNSESYFESFKLKYDGHGNGNPAEIGLVSPWINTVVDRRVKHLHVSHFYADYEEIQMPPNLYTCESLVSIKLTDVNLGSPKFVSLPSLKVMDLTIIHSANDLVLETLISGCPVLKSLYIERGLSDDYLNVLRVSSQSLLSFTHISQTEQNMDTCYTDNLVVAINAPRLRYLKLGDYSIASFILNNTSSLIEANINAIFNCWSFKNKFENDLQKRKMIRSFLEGIFCVKDMTITSETLEVIYYYSRCEQLPLFRSLSFLRVIFTSYRWEMLPIFLESCPNLKSLVVASADFLTKESSILSGPQCLLSSLEYVDIERPLQGKAEEMKLLRYFLQNSAIQEETNRLLGCFHEEKKRICSPERTPYHSKTL